MGRPNVETRGRDSARKLKVLSVGAVFLAVPIAFTSPIAGSIVFIGGLLGFSAARIME
jgi:hypothetical protein